ncbi:hypothetical protein [Streptomyces noursei]|uniref:hypothetical protein n=1 Tax=Streptomyces noursei TaxID=1971 RepID=UPI001964F65F|nr:hypothetical protein [Streptomyces noursei]QRX94852.1 hypothetical protein JNO44_32055 [Streptomyces noursei]
MAHLQTERRWCNSSQRGTPPSSCLQPPRQERHRSTADSARVIHDFWTTLYQAIDD